MSMRTDVQYHDDHLRRLLDQRTARADLHGRFPSLSEFSDSPSIYSHAPFSPRPVDRADVDAGSSYGMASHSRQTSEPRSPMSVMSDRQRLNIPHASSLDLDDDPRSSCAGTSIHDDDEDDISTQEGDNEDDDGELHRVSAYGPKMIVHSRAPWETGEDDVRDSGEPDSRRGGFMFSKGDNSKKAKSLNGRNVPNNVRPSFDSVRSQGKGKHSFDTVSSNISAGGALLALAQASMSSTSLALSQTSSPQTSLRDKLALPRFRSRTPSNTIKVDSADARSGRPNLASPSPHSSPAPHFRALSPVGAEFYRTDPRQTYTEPSTPHTPLHQQEYHPYANPDLVRAYTRDISPARRLEELHALANPIPQSPVVSRAESSTTLTDSSTTTTLTTFQSRSDTATSMTSGTSVASVPTQNDFSPTTRSFGKGISAPILIDSVSALPSHRTSNESGGQASSAGSKQEGAFPPVAGLAGWTENTTSAPIKLISLEEAQAQARERSRSATANGAPVSSGSSRVPGQTSGNRSRTRTISASGARTKNTTSSSTVDAESAVENSCVPPQKTISRKKSGFMRLFNGKEKVQSPPPVPSISMDIVPPTPPQARNRKQSSHRVPVPSLTPSLFVDAEHPSGSSSSECRSDAEGTVSSHSSPSTSSTTTRPTQLSLRRNAPGLSIVTHAPPGTSTRVIESGLTPATAATDVMFNSSLSSSPDPRPDAFVGLSLRPMSSIFSGDFTGRLDGPGSDTGRPSLEPDLGTPTTNTTAISPRSPAYPDPDIHTEKDESLPISVPQEDQSAVIQVLQEQILTARRAWQRQVWELEGQVRDLKAEVEDLRASDGAEYCSTCGRGTVGKPSEEGPRIEDLKKAGVKVGGVVNRPRARTGVGSRFASGI